MFSFKSCCKCNQIFNNNEVIIKVKHNANIFWHSYCFKCNTCDELLVDLIYFYTNKLIFCGRHFSEQVKPRCAACDEVSLRILVSFNLKYFLLFKLIFSKEYTKAENQNWHLGHFCCWKCDIPLGGTKYLVVDSKPYCLECHCKIFSKVIIIRKIFSFQFQIYKI